MAIESVPDWAIERAIRLLGEDPTPFYISQIKPESSVDRYQATWVFARYIAEHEQPPVDPLLIEARKFAEDRGWYIGNVLPQLRAGKCDNSPAITDIVAALRRGIELAKDTPHV